MCDISRRTGVRIIGALCFLVAGFGFVTQIRGIGTNGVINGLFIEPPARNRDNLAQLAMALAAVSAIFPALYGLAGWGLWRSKAWARKLAMSLFVIGFAFSFVHWLLTPFKASHLIATVVTLMLYAAIIMYLAREDVKAEFSAT